jgi:spore germination protein GerM
VRARRTAGFRLVAAAFGAALTLAACGVPTDGSPHAIANDDLPLALRTDASTTTSAPASEQDLVAVYWIRGDNLVRAVDTVAAPATLDSTLDLLQRGPTDVQTRRGDRSALSGTELIRAATTNGTTAVIDLDPSFTDTPQSDQILALGQLVLTATDRPNIANVRFTVDGTRTQVPRADGTLTTQPLRAADYRALVAGR